MCCISQKRLMTGACHDYRIQPSCSCSGKFCTRTIQAKSLAQYNLELVPYENEAEFLMSKEGERIEPPRRPSSRNGSLARIRERARALQRDASAVSADRFQMSVHGAAEVLRKTMQFPLRSRKHWRTRHDRPYRHQPCSRPGQRTADPGHLAREGRSPGARRAITPPLRGS